jgi:hypothetical protein
MAEMAKPKSEQFHGRDGNRTCTTVDLRARYRSTYITGIESNVMHGMLSQRHLDIPLLVLRQPDSYHQPRLIDAQATAKCVT